MNFMMLVEYKITFQCLTIKHGMNPNAVLRCFQWNGSALVFQIQIMVVTLALPMNRSAEYLLGLSQDSAINGPSGCSALHSHFRFEVQSAKFRLGEFSPRPAPAG
jgi:hypothetical protein